MDTQEDTQELDIQEDTQELDTQELDTQEALGTVLASKGVP
ncbi:MAG: hypothetical protein WBZ33_04715 [Thermoactinomyces sp.]